MTTKPFNLNHWLRKNPQPVVVLADDERITVGKGGRAWLELTKTIQAMEAVATLKCLDAAGNVLRAISFETESTTTKGETPLGELARLVADAYKNASNGNQQIVENALAYTNSLAARLVATEAELDRVRNLNHDLVDMINQATGGGEAGEGNSVMDMFMQGMMMKQKKKKLHIVEAKADGGAPKDGK